MVAGMPALKECPDSSLAFRPMCGSRRDLSVFVKTRVDRNFVGEKENTGKFFSTAVGLESCKLFKQLNGQILLSFISNISTNWAWPFFVFLEI
jgi:hypothetical protein